MADTHVKRIVEEIASLLDGTGKPAGLTVSTSRTHPTPSNEDLKHIIVYPVRDTDADNISRNRTFHGSLRQLLVNIECHSAGTDMDNESLRAWAYGQLMQDPSLGGKCLNITEGDTTWEGESDSNTDYSLAALEVLVEYVRPRNTLLFEE